MKGSAATVAEADAESAAGGAAATDEGQDPGRTDNLDSTLSSSTPARTSESGGEASPPPAVETPAAVATVRQE